MLDTLVIGELINALTVLILKLFIRRVGWTKHEASIRPLHFIHGPLLIIYKFLFFASGLSLSLSYKLPPVVRF